MSYNDIVKVQAKRDAKVVVKENVVRSVKARTSADGGKKNTRVK